MQVPWQEKLLLYRAYERDTEAFGKLYDLYAPKLYRYIYFKVRTPAEAEDLTAEVFLKTWEYLQRGDDPIKSFRAFIYQLARNVVVDHYRSQANQPVTREDAVLERVAVPEELSAIVVAERASDMAVVESALRGLKDEYREVIILRYIEEYSTAEIAKVMKKSRGAVRVTLHRALEALRQELDTRN